MTLPRHSLARAANTLSLSNAILKPASRRALSASARRPAADHGDHYDPPTGWLWGIKPGEKPEKEGWENVFIYGMFGSLGLAAIAYAFKPDTSIQTWALEEARRRLEAEGILEEPQSKP